MSNSAFSDAQHWLQPITDGNNHAALICFPFAGSGAALFASWRPLMFRGVDLVAARLPGREGRFRETPYDNLGELVEVLAASIANSRYCRSPLFLLGCSVGALVAFELTRSLQRRGISVDYLIVVASRAPQAVRTGGVLHKLSDDEFIRKLQERYAAIPAEVMANEELKRLLLPMLRADMKMFEAYSYREAPKLGCPILAMGGTEDKSVPVRELLAWRNQTNSFGERLFPGDHYFIKQSTESVLQTIAQRVKPHLAD